jgi:hypothetical protein
MFLKDPLISMEHIRDSLNLHIREGVALDWIIVKQNSDACSSPEVQTFLKIIYHNDGMVGGVDGKRERRRRERIFQVAGSGRRKMMRDR